MGKSQYEIMGMAADAISYSHNPIIPYSHNENPVNPVNPVKTSAPHLAAGGFREKRSFGGWEVLIFSESPPLPLSKERKQPSLLRAPLSPQNSLRPLRLCVDHNPALACMRHLGGGIML